MFEIWATKVFQSLALIFDPSWSSKVIFDDANRKPVFPTYKCSHVVSVTVFEIFRVKILAVGLLTLAGLTLSHRSPKAEMTYYPRRSTILQNFSTITQTVYEICVTKVFHFLAPGGLTPGPKFTERGNDLADSEIYHPAKFRRPTSTHARYIRYQNSCGHTKNKQTNSKRYIHSMPIGMCG